MCGVDLTDNRPASAFWLHWRIASTIVCDRRNLFRIQSKSGANKMARSKNPISVIFSMTLLGTFVSVVVRFAYSAYIIVQSGESLASVSVKLLLIDVMELHRFALYGAGGGATLGIILVLVDLLRSGGQAEDYSWKYKEVVNPFYEDEVKAQRMEIGDRYQKEHPPKGQNGDTK